MVVVCSKVTNVVSKTLVVEFNGCNVVLVVLFNEIVDDGNAETIDNVENVEEFVWNDDKIPDVVVFNMGLVVSSNDLEVLCNDWELVVCNVEFKLVCTRRVVYILTLVVVIVLCVDKIVVGNNVDVISIVWTDVVNVCSVEVNVVFLTFVVLVLVDEFKVVFTIVVVLLGNIVVVDVFTLVVVVVKGVKIVVAGKSVLLTSIVGQVEVNVDVNIDGKDDVNVDVNVVFLTRVVLLFDVNVDEVDVWGAKRVVVGINEVAVLGVLTDVVGKRLVLVVFATRVVVLVVIIIFFVDIFDDVVCVSEILVVWTDEKCKIEVVSFIVNKVEVWIAETVDEDIKGTVDSNNGIVEVINSGVVFEFSAEVVNIWVTGSKH